MWLAQWDPCLKQLNFYLYSLLLRLAYGGEDAKIRNTDLTSFVMLIEGPKIY